MDFYTPTELPSLSSFKPGSDGVYFTLNLGVFVHVSSQPSPPCSKPAMASHREPPVPGGFFGDFCFLHTQVMPRAGLDIPKAGKQEPGPCLCSSPAFTIPLLPLHQGRWAESAVMGAQSFLLSSKVGHGCSPPRATGSLALQLPLSRMRKYWICFVKGRKKKIK